MNRTLRVASIVVLLSCLSVSFVAYGSLDPLPQRNIYPGGDDLVREYDTHVGKQVSISGTVTSTDPVVVRTGDGSGRQLSVTVSETTADPQVGDRLHVVGALSPDEEVVARNTFVVPDSGLTYTYSVSAIAGVWVLFRSLKQWRPTDSFGLLPRETQQDFDSSVDGGDEL